MDQSQWNTLVNKQIGGQKTTISGGAAYGQTQYKTVLAGGQQQQQYIVVPEGQTTSRAGQQKQASANSLNGTSASGETEIVKSLLTGRQYGQSVLRPDVGRKQTAKPASAAPQGKPMKQQQQVSLLQSNWQGQADAAASSTQADANAIQQLINYSDLVPEGVAPGEVMYMMVGDVTYEIVGASKPGGEATITPVTSGISLEDLAAISAEQETLKSEYSYQIQSADGAAGDATANIVLDGQQYLQQSQDGTLTTTADGMQVIMMSGDGYVDPNVSAVKVQEGYSLGTGTTIKLNGQDFVLQAGQQLPAELQEMVAKGLPVDLSNYEFVIEGDGSQALPEGCVYAQGDAELQMAAASSIATAASIGGPSAKSQLTGGNVAKQEPQPKNGIFVQVITASPGEYDDGEFTYLASDQSQQAATGDEQRMIPNSGFLNSFLSFVQGNKVETLSSVVNSSVGSKPGMQKYATGQGRRQSSLEDKKYKPGTPITVIYTGDQAATSSQGRSILLSNQDSQHGDMHTKAMKRKRNTDSEGEEVGSEKVSKILSADDYDVDPNWKPTGTQKSGYEDEYRLSIGRGRGRGRGRPSSSQTASPAAARSATSLVQDISRGTIINNEPPIELPVTYVMQNEPHGFLKGDFVIDRKDCYKINDFPIWRIENGKLLQKFDPCTEDGKLLHKSASVYSSWSGDIRSNFKPILVDVISMTPAMIGRKQDVVVQMHDKYVTKPVDEALEQNALMQLFNICVHVLLNQSFEPSYLAAIQQQQVDYYLEPLAQIDQLLIEAKQAILGEIAFKDNFKNALETLSCYTYSSVKSDQLSPCEATMDGGIAVKIVKFYGQVYDRESLVATQEVPLSSPQEFLIGKQAFENVGIYHALHHFKYLLFKKCQEEATHQNTVMGKAAEQIPDECIQNRIWVQQLFSDLKALLERYIIIKTEDEVDSASTLEAMEQAL